MLLDQSVWKVERKHYKQLISIASNIASEVILVMIYGTLNPAMWLGTKFCKEIP